MAKLKITRTRGRIGRTARQRATLEHLGLKRINATVVREDSAVVRGMLRMVWHMVRVEEIG